MGEITPIDKLVDQLSRPIYVLRMARAQEDRKDAMGHSAKARAAGARREIAGLIEAYVLGKR